MNPDELIIIEDFPSEFIKGKTVGIYLPENYSEEGSYAVLYMHDGQLLFDRTVPRDQDAWQADITLNRMIANNQIMPTIIVGMWNAEQFRHAEYHPQKPFESLDHNVQKSIISNSLRPDNTPVYNTSPYSDLYLRFIVEELKPYIDTHYSTLSDITHTCIAGSSMGGLISLYALCEFPDVFGGAACISTHWPGLYTNNNNPIPETVFSYLINNLPNPGQHRIYFDYGTEDLDQLYEVHQQKVNAIFQEKNYDQTNFKCLKIEGTGHNEKDWADRLDIALGFLLSKEHQ